MAARLLARDERRLEVGRERVHAGALQRHLDVLALAGLVADASAASTAARMLSAVVWSP